VKQSLEPHIGVFNVNTKNFQDGLDTLRQQVREAFEIQENKFKLYDESLGKLEGDILEIAKKLRESLEQCKKDHETILSKTNSNLQDEKLKYDGFMVKLEGDLQEISKKLIETVEFCKKDHEAILTKTNSNVVNLESYLKTEISKLPIHSLQIQSNHSSQLQDLLKTPNASSLDQTSSKQHMHEEFKKPSKDSSSDDEKNTIQSTTKDESKPLKTKNREVQEDPFKTIKNREGQENTNPFSEQNNLVQPAKPLLPRKNNKKYH
jgi:hypothetical protein